MQRTVAEHQKADTEGTNFDKSKVQFAMGEVGGVGK